jgi:hypothetical protein
VLSTSIKASLKTDKARLRIVPDRGKRFSPPIQQYPPTLTLAFSEVPAVFRAKLFSFSGVDIKIPALGISNVTDESTVWKAPALLERNRRKAGAIRGTLHLRIGRAQLRCLRPGGHLRCRAGFSCAFLSMLLRSAAEARGITLSPNIPVIRR